MTNIERKNLETEHKHLGEMINMVGQVLGIIEELDSDAQFSSLARIYMHCEQGVSEAIQRQTRIERVLDEEYAVDSAMAL